MSRNFSKREAIKIGWEVTKKNFGFFAIVLIISLFINFLPEAIERAFKDLNLFALIAINFIGIIFSVIVGIGLIKVFLKVFDQEKAELKDLFSHYDLFFKYLAGLILYGLIVFAGLMLLIVPGIILGIKFYFFSYFIIDKKLGPIKALKESSRITKGNKWNLFLFFSLIAIIDLIGLLFFFVGLILTVPITMTATVFVYRKLLKEPKVENNIE